MNGRPRNSKRVAIIEKAPQRGEPPRFGDTKNRVPDVIEGDSITTKPSKESVAPQGMKN
jgi:hypothetical protein